MWMVLRNSGAETAYFTPLSAPEFDDLFAFCKNRNAVISAFYVLTGRFLLPTNQLPILQVRERCMRRIVSDSILADFAEAKALVLRMFRWC